MAEAGVQSRYRRLFAGAALALATAAMLLAPQAPALAQANIDTNVDVDVSCPKKAQHSRACKRIKKRTTQADEKPQKVVKERVEAGDGSVYNAVAAMLEPIVDYWTVYAIGLAYGILCSLY